MIDNYDNSNYKYFRAVFTCMASPKPTKQIYSLHFLARC